VSRIKAPKDTVQIKLQSHSILVTNGKLQKEITFLPSTALSFYDFHISTYTVNNVGRGLTFWAGRNRHVEIEVWDWKEAWSWKIVVREGRKIFLMDYNSFRKNRIETIMLQDDSLKYGMSISMTFKSLKKLWWLRAVYIDTVTVNGRNVVTNMPIDNPYWYRYKKSGKIDKKSTFGEMKLCDCE
jgi:hypothetical protein